MIYLFCSAAAPLYKRDALETLCYPPNHIFRFRYDRRYVQPEILERPHRFEGEEGILIFADTVGRPDTMDFNFFPVRIITTLRLTPRASAIYVDFRLGDFLNYRQDDLARSTWDQSLKALPNRPWPPPDKSGRAWNEQGYFLLSAGSDRQFFATDSLVPYENWQSVVQRLDDTKDLGGSTFYLILGFYRVKRRRWTWQYHEIPLPSTDNGHDSIYSVPMGKSVVLKILLSRPTFDYANSKARRMLKITAGGEAFSGSSKDTVYSESRYNEDRTILVCKRVFDTALSTVSIHEPDEPEIRSPRTTLLIRIRVPRWVVGVVILGVAMSTGLLALDIETVNFVSSFLPRVWALKLGLNAKAVAGIAKTLSPLPVSVSAYLAFRRLPIK